MSDVSPATTAGTAPGGGRIAFLDGLRGVAILMVVAFHAYARWPEHYPFGARFVGNPFLDTDRTGVLLFFMISGFVILMSLEKNDRFGGFLWRRWLRLFPAMLVCSLAVFALSVVIVPWPKGPLAAFNLLPGLTLLGEDVWMRLTGLSWDDVASIEGSFWSLYVETRFYLIFGALYYLFGRTTAVWGLLGVYALLHLFRVIDLPMIRGNGALPLESIAAALQALHGYGALKVMGAPYFLWFFAGAMYYLWEMERRERHYAIAVVASLVAALSPIAGCGPRLFVVGLMAAVMRFEAVRRVVANPVFLILGFASYPLYLMHENLMVALIVRVGAAWPGLPALAVPVLPIVLVIAVGWLVARFVEPGARRTVARLVGGLARPRVRTDAA
ncbi:acyltransferase [Siculibacillus lacustris]|uniref:Acyltransferase n=1 Tax=Siculibacillus lacustris TaxID=1549641 RepID=A0A4Q9VY38_9HYPH|nr:acyltransferase [Siculibacillus lacustris]TBW40885.1 acyltransferase [Siculibacillus lacustris]